ncbi:sigma-54-dependent transcriptional regulator [Piscinibacter sakaiensis]|uniref:Sigma-54 dependent response regulator n=1 Tax=Piscinibacter sakaiensis TaxID=1547922 RepID=A0A0K8NTI7_PISS1|nr:sigma-54 dependent transcriptional regulator [Piscinibacter sakaiensis]GAP33726.1 sigma-54 dependent response regulator [Piscinibacter sakaiensis]
MSPASDPSPAAPDDTAAALPDQVRWPHAAVLVVDDEPGMCHFLERMLAPRVGQVRSCGSAEDAEQLLQRQRCDLLILDITLPGASGLTLLKRLRARGDGCEVVLITAFADLDTAIEALRAGASDFLLKPFRATQVLAALQRGLERARLKRENWLLRRTLEARTPPADGLVGRSIPIKGLRAALQRVAAVDSTVLLTGESGTGKELAAAALHALSPHAAGPFVPVNCALMSPALIEGELFGHGGERRQRDGLFVYAQGGTLFLDEVGELPPPLQATLLRVLEDRRIRPVGSEHELPVAVRIVAASNRPLIEEVEAGRFRKDLYYRLQVVEIALPPLRSHKEDIPDLVAHFVATLAPRLGVPPIEVSADELAYLAQYDWPGNVRELRNLIERSLIVGALNVSALYQGLARSERRGRVPASAPTPAPPAPPAAVPAGPVDLQTLEKRHILAVLDSVDGDKTRAAQLLGISRRTLERRWAEWQDGGAAAPPAG